VHDCEAEDGIDAAALVINLEEAGRDDPGAVCLAVEGAAFKLESGGREGGSNDLVVEPRVLQDYVCGKLVLLVEPDDAPFGVEEAVDLKREW